MIPRPVVAALLLALAFGAAHGACVRTKPGPPPGDAPPSFDGPGSFGPLHGTVTLDCLKYTGSISRAGVEHVLIRDDEGTIHRLKIGDYMGENGGVIHGIEATHLVIEQLVRRDGELRSVMVKFPKTP